MTTEEQQIADVSARLHPLEQEEARLWRVLLLFVMLVALALGVALWEDFRGLGWSLQLVPVFAVGVAIALAAYGGHKRRRITQLRSELRALHLAAAAPQVSSDPEQLARTLERSQRSYRDLVDSFDDLVLGLALDGTIQSANRAFASLLDKNFPDFMYHRLNEFIEQPSAADAQAALPGFLRRRQWAGVVEVRFQGASRPRFFDCAFRAILTGEEAIGVSVWAREVTDRRERETRFTELFETLHEGVYFSTPDGSLLDANQALVKILGFESKAELMSINVPEIYIDPAERLRFLLELDSHGMVQDREIRLRRKDGTPIICLDSARAVYDSEGKAVRYQGTLVDITQRRQMEQRLHEQEEFNRRVIDCFPDAIVALDAEGKCTFASPRIREVLGFDTELLVGKPFLPDVPEARQVFTEVLDGKRALASSEFVVQRLYEGWHTLRCTASPLFEAGGKLVGVVASLRDVTEAHRVQEQLIQHERLAAMGQMIEGFAHELNNPLTAILGAVDLAIARVRDSDSMRELRVLKEQARRAAETVQNLLFFSRQHQAGSTRLNLNELVNRTLMLHHYSLRNHNISIDFQPNNSLPLYEGDGNQLMQVFFTVIVHAEQIIRGSHERGTVHVRLGRDKGWFWVKLHTEIGGQFSMAADTGEPTSQSRHAQADDMALSMAKGILKSLNGTLEVKTLGKGEVQFSISLPETQATATPTANAASGG